MKQIGHYFDRTLDLENLVAQYEQGSLRQLVEGAFCLDWEDASKDSQAIVILDELFQRLLPTFSFQRFVESIPNTKERKSFLIQLLFQIYSLQFPLMRLQDERLFRFYLLQQLAHSASSATMRHLLQEICFTDQVALLGYLFAFYDEGSYAISKEIKGLSVKRLLQEGMIHRQSLWLWAKEQQEISPEALQHFVKACKRELAAKCKTLHSFLADRPLAQIKRFVAVFGLYDHQLPEALLFLDPSSSLDEKLHEPLIFRIHEHMEALSEAKERYREGYKLLLHALPTSGKLLKKLAWLESTAASIARFCKIVEVEPNPIVVFDQSEPALFEKNRRYIETVKRRFGIDIIHIDKKSLINLAKERGILDLVVTGPNQRIGYGGARNAIFLLAPLVAQRKDRESCIIHMGDDDVLMPTSTIFSDALWAYRHKDVYAARFGYIEGRCTSDINFLPSQVLYKSEAILAQCFWMKLPSLHGMSGLLSKPKLCLNLPFGQEEHHFLALIHETFDLRRPSMHLGGARYPDVADIPTSRFSGLAEWLKGASRDIFERLFVTELLDPNNRYHSCALPWNLEKAKCQSFAESLALILRADLQKPFWKNVARNEKAFTEGMPQGKEILSSHALEELIETDLEALFEQFLQREPHLRGAKELEELKRFFSFLQQQAKGFKEKDPHSFLTEILELLRQSVGLGGFQKAVKEILPR